MSNQLAAALRQIADYKQTPCDGDPSVLREYARQALAAHEAAKPAEPVAWRYKYKFHDIGETGAYEYHSHDFACVARLPKGEPLYAAPVAVASPLSDEQLDRLEDGCWDGPGLGARFDKRKFARAIEQAHSIKEKP